MADEVKWTQPAPSPQWAAPPEGLTTLPPGSRIGKYQIESVLGQGGFGITYQARDTQLDREVAIKEYLPTSFAARQSGSQVLPHSTQLAEDFRWGRDRFLTEAKTLAHLEHAKGIVNVYDFLEANGTAYMVMALVPGETLEAKLRREGRLAQASIERLLYPLLDGLERVHQAGFLHRDIKPANILIDRDGAPALIDFGASRVALQGRTQAMTAIFTPGYAAFEQMSSAPQGPWTDIYALAGTLYHCVTGALPPPAVDRMTADRLVPAMVAGQGYYAPGLLAAIDAGLALKAEARPQSIAHWRTMFPGVAVTAAPMPGASTTRSMAEPVGGPRRRGWLWPAIAAAVVALCLAGGAGVYLMLEQRARVTRAQAAAEDAAWAQARAANSEAAFRAYLASHPAGRHATEARQAVAALEQAQRADSEAWTRAKATNTDAGLRAYVDLFPGGRFAAEARREIERLETDAWTRAKAGDSEASYREYVNLYPAGRFATEARGELERRDRLRTRQPFRDCEVCPEMIMVPRGSFMMGAAPGEEEREGVPKESRGGPEPAHQVTFKKDFALGRYPITLLEFAAFVTSTGREMVDGCTGIDGTGNWDRMSQRSWRSPGFAQIPRQPVVCVSAQDAQAYVAWLSKTTGKKYRLPTEAEWEYAARAGTTTIRYWGDGRLADTCQHANVADQTAFTARLSRQFAARFFHPCNDRFVFTSPVDAFPANPWGFHDMLGNVRQWVSDCLHGSGYHGAPTDGRSWDDSGDCSNRMVRGASWLGTPYAVRSSFRASGESGSRYAHTGFRVALDN